MTTERDDLLNQLDDATERLVATVARLTDDEMRQDSLLPGWTRGHVISHIARNSDALVNLLTWARTGVETPAYRSQAARDADIEAGADRPAAELVADLVDSAAAFGGAARALPEAAWTTPVRVLAAPLFPAEQLPARRLVEVELHHTDLGVGYRAADWPAAFTDLDLAEPMRSWRVERRSW